MDAATSRSMTWWWARRFRVESTAHHRWPVGLWAWSHPASYAVMLREVAAPRIQASKTMLPRSTRKGMEPKEDGRPLTRH